MGNLRLEINITHIAITITSHVVHDRCHRPGRPGVAFVEVGRAHLACQAEFDIQIGIMLVASQSRSVPVVVALTAVTGIEGG